MPARHHRAEKKKKRSNDAAHKSKPRSKALRPASAKGGSSAARKPSAKPQKQAPPKASPAKASVPARPGGKGVEAKVASAAKAPPTTGAALSKGKPAVAVAAAKTKGTPGKPSPVVARESGVGKGA